MALNTRLLLARVIGCLYLFLCIHGKDKSVPPFFFILPCSNVQYPHTPTPPQPPHPNPPPPPRILLYRGSYIVCVCVVSDASFLFSPLAAIDTAHRVRLRCAAEWVRDGGGPPTEEAVAEGQVPDATRAVSHEPHPEPAKQSEAERSSLVRGLQGGERSARA